ncbi:hypothetical protein [Pontibaca salina]|nr:hypothetical protein [Pontibaca salina]
MIRSLDDTGGISGIEALAAGKTLPRSVNMHRRASSATAFS